MTRRNGGSGLMLAVGLGMALLIISFTRIAGEMSTGAFDGPVIDSVLSDPIWRTALGRNVALFAIALLLLHVCFGLLCWALAWTSERVFPSVRATRGQWILLWATCLAVWLFLANAALFPHSSLGEPYAQFARATWLGISPLQACTTLLLGMVGTTLALGLVNIARKWKYGLSTAAMALLVAGLAITRAPTPPAEAKLSDKPHVIIIGLDALRPDAARMHDRVILAPNIREFLSKSTVFSDATTPLARTFPSWVSILTGRNPHTTGAVVNLLPRNLIHTGGTLPDLFKRAGYRTAYAIDDVEFSNVDQSYGFDRIVTPPIGATGFLLAWFGDTPLSNLLVNTRLGAALFPYLHANRAAAVTYVPEAFIGLLDRELRFDAPTFLAIHLTLAHWPYFWADAPGEVDRFGNGDAQYALAVQALDHQFAELLDVLRRRGALKNACVIVLSDHGEALGRQDDLLVDKGGALPAPENDYQRRGHGTSVLSPHQYHVVLGIRAFGTGAARLPQPPRVLDVPVSLEDVAPTLAELFAFRPELPFDGRSWVGLLHDEPDADQSFRDRVRFTESEFNPKGVSITKVSASGLRAAALFYHVDPVTDRLEMRESQVRKVLENRQYAAFVHNKLLAALPSPTGGYMLVTADTSGAGAGSMRPISSADAHADPDLDHLQRALRARYAITIAEVAARP